jgi:hypothetical protein
MLRFTAIHSCPVETLRDLVDDNLAACAQDEDDEAYLKRFDNEVTGATAADGNDPVHDEADYPDSEDDEAGDYLEEDEDGEGFDSENDDEDDEDEAAAGTHGGDFRSEAGFEFSDREYSRFGGGHRGERSTAGESETGNSHAADGQWTEVTNTTSSSCS